MRKLVFILLWLFYLPAAYADQSISESDYLANYGNCPCPYNVTVDGQSCGYHSAWCRKRGYSPACALTRVTNEMIEDCKFNR